MGAPRVSKKLTTKRALYPSEYALANIAARQREVYAALGAKQHLNQYVRLLAKMHELADRLDGRKDEAQFSAYSKLADHHWRVVDRYLPKQIEVSTPTPSPGSLDALRSLLEPRLAPPMPDPEQPSLEGAPLAIPMPQGPGGAADNEWPDSGMGNANAEVEIAPGNFSVETELLQEVTDNISQVEE